MTTRQVLNIQNTYTEEIDFFRPTFSNWELIDQKEVSDGKEALYQLMAGDPAYPATIRIGIYEKNGKQSISGKFTTYTKKTDDNSVVSYHKKTYTIAISSEDVDALAGDSGGDRIAIENLAAFCGFIPPLATPLASGGSLVYDHTVAARLMFGVPTFDPGDMDDPASA